MAVKAKTKLKPRGKAFEKGHSVKSPGAPVKEMRLSTWIEKELDNQLGRLHSAELDLGMQEYTEEVSRRQAIAKRLVNMALHKSDHQLALQAIKEIADRTEGKPQQKVDHTTRGESITPILGGLVIAPEDD